MIDIATETVIPLREAAKLVPRRRRGRKVAHSTIWRWIERGVRGIRLEALDTPSGLVTSRESIQRFFERLTAASGRGPVGRTTTTRRKRIAAAERELAEAGI